MMNLLKRAGEAMGLIDRRVQIGITDRALGDPHGTVSVGREKIGFTVDHPKLLKRPTVSTLDDIFEQFIKLGVTPSAIELTVGKFRRVYQRKGVMLVLTHESSR